MPTQLIALKDAESGVTVYFDQASGRKYSDPEGMRQIGEMHPTEMVLGEGGNPVRHGDGRPVHCADLANYAVEYYYGQIAQLTGRPVPVTMRDPASGQRFEKKVAPERLARDADGRLVLLDLGVADVHTPATLPNYAAGYKIADGVADIASPAFLVPHQSDVYYTWNASSDFNRRFPNIVSSGGGIAQVNPGLSTATYSAKQYALSGVLPTEVQTNADAPLKPFQKMVQIVVDAMRLEREIRVASLLQTSANWNSNLVNTLTAGNQWDGGASSDPVANLHKAIENSYMPVTGIVWSELVEHDFLRNPAVQKYFTFKDMIDGLPDPQKLSSTLRLPPIYTAMMKYTTGGAVLTYVWGNHVVLLRTPKETPPTTQMDIATSYTMRWNGGSAPDTTTPSGVSPIAGLMVRTYFDPRLGARGSTVVVVTHSDDEQMTSGLVGGLILNAHQ